MLPAGHVLRVRAGGECHTKPFAKIEDAYVARPAQPLSSGELRSLLCDSVSHHLVSDVPVGVFLSAGIDSNVVAALASELSPNLQSITLAFDEYAGTDDDEAPLAEAAARALGCEHTTYRIGRSEFESLIDDFFDCMDQPTIDGLNTYLVSYAAAKLGLKVALSGLGGDELFGGYPSFRDVPQLAQWGRRLSSVQPFGDMVQRALRTIGLPGMPPKLPGLFTHSASLANAYLLRRALYLEDELDILLDESWISEGLERLATQPALAATVAPLRAAAAPEHAQIAALEFVLVHAQSAPSRYRLVEHGTWARSPCAIRRLRADRKPGAGHCFEITPEQARPCGLFRSGSSGNLRTGKDRVHHSGSPVDCRSGE